jgi:hypothetical protein
MPPSSRLAPPRASAMIEALRGLGYSTAGALADIIDNSTPLSSAAYRAAPKIAACVDALAGCTGADKWTAAKLAKMKLHALIASSHEAKPHLSPAYVWSDKTNLVPLNDPIFDQISDFLQTSPAM